MLLDRKFQLKANISESQLLNSQGFLAGIRDPFSARFGVAAVVEDMVDITRRMWALQ